MTAAGRMNGEGEGEGDELAFGGQGDFLRIFFTVMEGCGEKK